MSLCEWFVCRLQRKMRRRILWRLSGKWHLLLTWSVSSCVTMLCGCWIRRVELGLIWFYPNFLIYYTVFWYRIFCNDYDPNYTNYWTTLWVKKQATILLPITSWVAGRFSEILSLTGPMCSLLPLCTATKSNSVAPPDEYVGNLWLRRRSRR